MKRPMLTDAGGTRAWSRTVGQFTAVNTVCWLRFPRCTIRAVTIDHYWPRKLRPDLVNEPSNYRPACLYCNRARRATPPHQIPRLRAKLEREARKRPKTGGRKALGFFG